MTVGQRIAQKRKELGLSQETLGEQLGVSRQAIYKWESDSTLPEIEKLIALSRIFGVSVGWLLGEEEASAPKELSEEQLRMVQEIVDRYLAARSACQPDTAPWWPEAGNPDLTPEQRRLVSAVADRVQESMPAPEAPKRRRVWPLVLVGLVFVVLLWNVYSRMQSISQDYGRLSASIHNISNNVASQIGNITNRVEEILQSQNDLTADHSTKVISVDPASGMVTLSFRVVPKTYQDGMVAWVDVVNEDARITVSPYFPEREVFSGEVTVALSDSIAMYIVFEHNGIRQTQLLDTHTHLLRDSFPSVNFHSRALIFSIDEKTNTWNEALNAHLYADFGDLFSTPTNISGYRIGLFANQKLVAWFTPSTKTVWVEDVLTEYEACTLSTEGLELNQSKEYRIAAVITDEYGREFILAGAPARWTAEYGWSGGGSYSSGPFFEGWTY